MTQVYYKGKSYPLSPEQTVLDCLLDHNIPASYSCKSGNCQNCILKTDQKNLPQESIEKLNDQQIDQGYFLPCQCKTTQDINIIDGESFYQSKVIEKHLFNKNTVRLLLDKPNGFDYRAGQFINIKCKGKNDLVRSYSLASHPINDQFLEIQVGLKPNGHLSGWMIEKLQKDDVISIQDASGLCFYISPIEKPMLLIATGTGISPLYGIIKDAISKGHQGDIELFYGGKNISSLYLKPELDELAKQCSNLNIHYSLSQQEINEHNINPGRASELALATLNNIEQYDVYICGNPDMVRATQMNCFLKGVAMDNIHTDPFEH